MDNFEDIQQQIQAHFDGLKNLIDRLDDLSIEAGFDSNEQVTQDVREHIIEAEERMTDLMIEDPWATR